jgi:hypothetical protein
MTLLLKKFLSEILSKLSPEIREELKKFMISLKEKAAATDNWWDDVLVDFLIDILGFSDI